VRSGRVDQREARVHGAAESAVLIEAATGMNDKAGSEIDFCIAVNRGDQGVLSVREISPLSNTMFR
jgi:hypothetical protein